MAARYCLLTVLLATTMLSANAHEFVAKNVRVEHPWVLPAEAAQRTAAINLHIRNDGDAAVQLVGVATTAGLARSAALVAVAAAKAGAAAADSASPAATQLTVPARSSVSSDAGGVRVVLHDLGVALTPGMRFPLFLTFASGMQLEVEVWVETLADHTAHAQQKH